MPRALRDNSLGIAFGVLFLATLAGQAIAGHKVFNEDQLAHGEEGIEFARYLTSSHFGQAVMENWQSEYLQFTLYILATVWLVQRGSPESKEIEQAGRRRTRSRRSASTPTPARRCGRRPAGCARSSTRTRSRC